eukprot:SAG31_NODE_362_length_16904_cov_7.893218_1_plen_249_part_00
MLHPGCLRYQAYNDQIADAAVAANSFRAPLEAGIWSSQRMTWIKPSAVWMAYRCGWTTKKDRNQARVLALDLNADAFRSLLVKACVTDGNSAGGAQKGNFKERPVVVQWDPERVMDAAAPPKEVFTRKMPEIRSIQIGLRGKAVEALLDPSFVQCISDVTSQFQKACTALERGDEAAAATALWPEKERPWYVDRKLRAMLEMDVVTPNKHFTPTTFAPVLLEDTWEVRSYFLVCVPTICEIRYFYREM